ncbi:MAG: hypothetical protein GX458_12485 [Phyllobacteriaceae bacterium]|nr:hypothetical protein [Phyllobacteriaceae bacterium]
MPQPAPETPKRRILGFCWFRRETYDQARAVMSDPDVLFEDFDTWLAAARKIEREVSASGDKVVRIRFDLPGFLVWCASRGRMPDEQARAGWAAEEARKRFGTRF